MTRHFKFGVMALLFAAMGGIVSTTSLRADDDKPAKKAVGKTPDQATLKTKLAETRTKIATTEKELAELRNQAKWMETELAKLPAAGPEKLYLSPQDLFADMPKDSYPISGDNGSIERAAARKWMQANLVGRTLKTTAKVAKVYDYGEDPFTVSLMFEDSEPTYRTVLSAVPQAFNPRDARNAQAVQEMRRATTNSYFQSCGEPIKFGDQSCLVMRSYTEVGPVRSQGIVLPDQSAADVKKYREYKGKTIVVRCKIVELKLGNNVMVEDPRQSAGLSGFGGSGAGGGQVKPVLPGKNLLPIYLTTENVIELE